MNKDDIKKRIQTEEDYIRYPRFQNSLAKFISKNENGVSDSLIAKVLMITEDRVKKIYQEALSFLKKEMGQNDKD